MVFCLLNFKKKKKSCPKDLDIQRCWHQKQLDFFFGLCYIFEHSSPLLHERNWRSSGSTQTHTHTLFRNCSRCPLATRRPSTHIAYERHVFALTCTSQRQIRFFFSRHLTRMPTCCVSSRHVAVSRLAAAPVPSLHTCGAY